MIFCSCRHEGCECDNGFTGEHCEIRSAANDEVISNSNNYRSGGKSGPSGVAVFFIVSGALVATVILALAYRRLSNQKEEIDFDDDGVFDDTTGPPVLDMGPEKDLEGNELENVEII
jgi:hypothetical protein